MSVSPMHDGHACIVRTECLPARGADTAELAEALADHTRMGDDDDPLAAMFGSDRAYGAQDAAAEVTVALAAGPLEAIVDLPQIGVPQDRIALLHLGDRHPFEAPAVNLAQ